MKLSICMMVKDEEKNLERCLKSLADLRNAVDSELIIVDTGSVDKTVEIAKKFTDRVYFHPWNNNFSEMRNITISYATGDWLFIIDADEELIISKPIINELKKTKLPYNALAIDLVNVISSNGALGSKLITLRFFKNDGDFYYEGNVHNKPVVQGNVLKVDGLLYHYGYVADDQSLMEVKFKRTSELLLAELEKNPNDIYYLYQLATSYDMYKDNERAVEYYGKAYNLIKDDNHLKKTHFYVYGSYVKTLVLSKKYDIAIDIAEEGLTIQKDYIDLMYFSGLSYLILKKYREGIDKTEKFLEYLGKLNSLEVYNNPNVQLFTANAREEAISNLCTIYNELGDFESAYKWLINSVFELEIKSLYFRNIFESCLRTCIELKQFEPLNILLNKLEEDVRSEYEMLLYRDLCLINSSSDFVKCVSQLSAKDSILVDVLKKAVEDRKIEINDSTEKLYVQGVKEIFIGLLDNKKKFTEYIAQTSEQTIMEVMGYLEERYGYFTNRVEKLHNIFCNNDMSCYNEIFCARLLAKYLFLVNINSDELLFLFEKYLLLGFKQIQYKYSLQFLNENISWNVLNSEEQLLVILYNFKKKPNKSDLEIVLEIMPEWKRVILEWVKTSCVESEGEAELQELTKIIKANIESFIRDGQLTVALNLVNDYLNIQPNDMEMLLLKTQLMLEDVNINQ